jgi:chemotaxis signal transduction protein
MTDEVRSMCFAGLADVLVAFDATYVERFVDSIQHAEPADVDLAALLNIELEVRLLNRRLAILSTRNGSLSLALGEHLHLESIAARSIQLFPQFARNFASDAGLAGLVARQAGFAFVIDLEQIIAASRQSESPRESKG